MARQRRLPQAPITEAVIDIRIRATSPVTNDTLAQLRQTFGDQYPKVEEQRSFEGLIHFDAGTVSQQSSDLGVVGLVFRSEQRREAVQVSGTGFAFSKLRPYTSWEEVLETARALWSRYTAHVGVDVVSRLGVRYINQFPVGRHRSVAQYLTNPPRPPEEIDASMVRNSFTRLLFRDERADLSVRFVQVTETADTGTNVIIDTDCFRAEEFTGPGADFWPAFGDLRKMKNTIFFGSITETAAEEFE